MSFPVYNIQAYIDRLAALKTASYPGVGTEAVLSLYTNNVSPDANMTVDTFDLAGGTGLAAIAVTMGAPSLTDQGLVVIRSQLITFSTLAGAPAVTVYGIVIINDDGDKVIAAQQFDTPQQLGGPYPQAVSGVWRVSEPLSSYGWLDAEA